MNSHRTHTPLMPLGGLLGLVVLVFAPSIRADASKTPAGAARAPSSSGAPGLLRAAYQEEIGFLTAEAKQLEHRLAEEEKKLATDERRAQKTQASLRARVLETQSAADKTGEQVETLRLRHDDKDALLSQVDRQFAAFAPRAEEAALALHIAHAGRAALTKIEHGRRITQAPGRFFGAAGESLEGEMVAYGDIARFGQSGRAWMSLAPTGTGSFAMYAPIDEVLAPVVRGGAPEGLTLLPTVLFSDPHQAIAKSKAPTLRETLDASGLIGWAIFALGLFGLVLLIIRTATTLASARVTAALERDVGAALDEQAFSLAADIVHDTRLGRRLFGPVFAVLQSGAATTTRAVSDEARVEEGLLAAQVHFERFSVAVLVVAAVAPLMGLLGTVTGMISTFDSITTFGTGDPRILSGGISEALLTTEFGLIVAIPTLLMGNLLSSWGRGLESRCEALAWRSLRTISAHRDVRRSALSSPDASKPAPPTAPSTTQGEKAGLLREQQRPLAARDLAPHLSSTGVSTHAIP